jgi:4-amino-4-deoxy-L-arabinose transferase-like glycosyltransferase
VHGGARSDGGSKPWLLLVFVLALVARLVWIATLAPVLIWPDEEEFVLVARHLAAGDGYVSTSYRANPVLPTYLAAVFRVTGESYAAARAGQAVFGALTCVLIAATATRLLSARVGTLAGLLLAVYVPHIYLSGVFYAECIFTLLIALTVHCAVGTVDDPRPRWLVATAVSFALAALTRPIFLAYLPALAAALAYAARGSGARRMALGVGLVVAVAIALLPWTLRNYLVLDRPVVVSSGFGTKLWQGNNEGAAGDADDRELYYDQDVWRERIAALPPAERAAVEARYRDAAARITALAAERNDIHHANDVVLGPLALEFIRTHPRRTVELFAQKLWTLFLPFSKTIVTNSDTTTLKRTVAAASYLPILALAMLGVWSSAGRTRGLTVIYGLLVSIAGTYALLTACTRFRLPLDPYLVLFAAAGIITLTERAQKTPGEPASTDVRDERARLSANAAHRAAVGYDQPIGDHARARRLETDR